MTVHELAVILVVEARGQLRIGDISAILNVSDGSTGAWVRQLEQAGIVERFKDHVNHRWTWVRMTAKGVRLRERARKNNREVRDGPDVG